MKKLTEILSKFTVKKVLKKLEGKLFLYSWRKAQEYQWKQYRRMRTNLENYF